MAERASGFLDFVWTEVRHALPATAFFAFGFCFILATQKLLLRESLWVSVSYFAAIMAALVVGKAVLVADRMPFLTRFDNAPLFQPVLFKSFVYWGFVFIARLVEEWLRHMIFMRGTGNFVEYVAAHIDWHRFLFIQAWIFVLFLIYTTASELNRLFGDGQLWRILFRYAPSDLQQSRRQRMRTLARLSGLAGRHTAAELRDPGSRAHDEALTLIENLAASETRTVKHVGPKHGRR